MVIALTSGRIIALHKTQVMKTLAGMLFMLVFFFCGSQAQGQDKDKETYYIENFLDSIEYAEHPPIPNFIYFGMARIDMTRDPNRRKKDYVPTSDRARVQLNPDALPHDSSMIGSLGSITLRQQASKLLEFYFRVTRWGADQIRRSQRSADNEQTTTSAAEGRNSILAMLSVIERLFTLNREHYEIDGSQGDFDQYLFERLEPARSYTPRESFGSGHQASVFVMFFYGFLSSNDASISRTDRWMSLSSLIQNAIDVNNPLYGREREFAANEIFSGASLQDNTTRKAHLKASFESLRSYYNYVSQEKIQQGRRFDFSNYFGTIYNHDRLAQSLRDEGGNIPAAYGLAYLLNSLLTGQFPEDSSEDLSIEAILRSAPALPLAQQTLMASLRGMPLTDIAELNRPAPPADGSLAGSRSSGDDNKTRETIRNIFERNLVIDPGSSNGRIPPLVLIGLSALEDDLRIQELNRNVIGRLLGIDMNQNTSDSTPTPASETGPIITENDRQTIRSQLKGYITTSYSSEIASEQILSVSSAITDLLLNLNDLDSNAMDQTRQVTELLKRYFKHFSSVLTDLVNNNNSDLQQVRNLKLLLEFLIERETKVHSPSSPANRLPKPPGPGGGAGGGAGACGGYTTSPY